MHAMKQCRKKFAHSCSVVSYARPSAFSRCCRTVVAFSSTKMSYQAQRVSTSRTAQNFSDACADVADSATDDVL